MRIGVLKCGNMHPDIQATYGSYRDLYARLLHTVAPDLDIFEQDVNGGMPLGAPDDADGWLISGSKHGVYDDLDWIAPLKAFVRDCIDDRVPVVGVCFGHQLLADALGGRSAKSDRGWGLGVHDYTPGAVPGWMGDLAKPWSGFAFHQDQIVTLPPTATVTASTSFCPYAALVYGDPEAPDAISVQAHPEFAEPIVSDLVKMRLENVVTPAILAEFEAGKHRPVAQTDWARAMVSYFEAAQARRPGLVQQGYNTAT